MNELEETDIKENPLNYNQHAFRKGSSCDSALSDMVNDIEKSIHRNEYALEVFLDVTGAFSNLSLEAAVNSMTKAQIKPEVRKWYTYHLKHRQVTADVKGIAYIGTYLSLIHI